MGGLHRAVFTLARFSEAFLVLRAQQSGIPIALVPLVMVAMNVIYALSAYPFGQLSYKMSHRKLLAFGLVVLVTADMVESSQTGGSARQSARNERYFSPPL